MSGKLYNLNTRCYATTLLTVSRNYANYHNTLQPQQSMYCKHHDLLQQTPLLPFTPASVRTFIHALVKYQVSTYLAYQSTDRQDDVIAETLFGVGVKLTPAVKYFIDDFLTVDEVDDIQVDLDLQLSKIICGENSAVRTTWNIIDVMDMSHSISVVVSEDLRIREWKQMKGYLDPCEPHLNLDLSEMLGYLTTTVNRQLKPIPIKHKNEVRLLKPGSMLNFKGMILDFLVSRHSFLRQEEQVGSRDHEYGLLNPSNADILAMAGLKAEAIRGFIDTLIKPVVESYAICHYINRLDNSTCHTITIDGTHLKAFGSWDGGFVENKVGEQQRLKELAESYLRGDYLPPADREAAERYIQENQ